MDYKVTVVNLLKNTGVKVHYFYPKNFKELPCVSYSILDDTTALQIGNREILVDLVVKIDVWCDGNTSTTEITERVKKVFSDVGFTRRGCFDLEDPSGLNHKTMRFHGQIDLRNNNVYQ